MDGWYSVLNPFSLCHTHTHTFTAVCDLSTQTEQKASKLHPSLNSKHSWLKSNVYKKELITPFRDNSHPGTIPHK